MEGLLPAAKSPDAAHETSQCRSAVQEVGVLDRILAFRKWRAPHRAVGQGGRVFVLIEHSGRQIPGPARSQQAEEHQKQVKPLGCRCTQRNVYY